MKDSISRVVTAVLFAVALWFVVAIAGADWPITSHSIALAGEGAAWFVLLAEAVFFIVYCVVQFLIAHGAT